MHISQHFLVSAPIAAGVSLLVSPATGAAFLTGSVLIDADHYLWYLLCLRDLSIRRARSFFLAKKNDEYYCLCVFHTIEAILLYIACLWLKGPMFWLAVGCLFHMGLDIAQSLSEHGMSDRKWSLIYTMVSWLGHKDHEILKKFINER